MGCGSSALPRVRPARPPPRALDDEEKSGQGTAGTSGRSNESLSRQSDSPPSFFSFSSFVLQNENPVLFDWHFHHEIGKGAMSHVFLATSVTTGAKAAAKVYNKNVIMKQTLGIEEPPYLAVQREIEIMVSLDHRYVLPINEVIEDDCSSSVIMLLPFADHGTLTSYMEEVQMSEELLSVCFFEIAEALRFVHENNVVHRDVKPDNILVFSEQVFCLSDFSVSLQLTSPDQKLVDTRGSPAFLSPEECGGDPFFPKPADVWAYGVTLYSCIFHRLPFKLEQGQGKNVANTVYAVSQLLETEELEIPSDVEVSQECIDLIRVILQKNPTDRPTFEDIIQSAWFEHAREVDKQNLENLSMNAAEEEEEEMRDEADVQ